MQIADNIIENLFTIWLLYLCDKSKKYSQRPSIRDFTSDRFNITKPL